MSARVVAFGPSLVDIAAKLDPATYEQCHEVLGIQAGEWRSIESEEELTRIRKLVMDGHTLPNSLVYQAYNGNARTLTPGSSTLGMIGALPSDIRSESRMVTALAEQKGFIDPLSTFFRQSLENMGITHDYNVATGYNPVGFVLSGTGANTEKTLAMYAGVAQELSDYPLRSRGRPDLVMVDAYELRTGKLANYLDSVITSREFSIALSLGNHAILHGELQQKIRSYIEGGCITILGGNRDEYQRIYEELDAAYASPLGFGNHPVGESVPYTLLTMGRAGLVARCEGRIFATPAFPMPPEQIVNTSGAGDTAFGAFCGGVLGREVPQDTMLRAAYLATRVLRVPGSMILADTLPYS